MKHFSQRKTQLFTRACKAVHGLAHLQTTPHCRPHLPSLTEPQPWRSCTFFSRQHTVPPVDLALAVPSAWSVLSQKPACSLPPLLYVCSDVLLSECSPFPASDLESVVYASGPGSFEAEIVFWDHSLVKGVSFLTDWSLFIFPGNRTRKYMCILCLCHYHLFIIYVSIIYQYKYVCVHVLALSNSCDPVDCSPPGSSVHGIFQAKILEWVAIFSSRGSSQPRNWTHMSYVSCIGRWIL